MNYNLNFTTSLFVNKVPKYTYTENTYGNTSYGYTGTLNNLNYLNTGDYVNSHIKKYIISVLSLDSLYTYFTKNKYISDHIYINEFINNIFTKDIYDQKLLGFDIVNGYTNAIYVNIVSTLRLNYHLIDEFNEHVYSDNTTYYIGDIYSGEDDYIIKIKHLYESIQFIDNINTLQSYTIFITSNLYIYDDINTITQYFKYIDDIIYINDLIYTSVTLPINIDTILILSDDVHSALVYIKNISSQIHFDDYILIPTRYTRDLFSDIQFNDFVHKYVTYNIRLDSILTLYDIYNIFVKYNRDYYTNINFNDIFNKQVQLYKVSQLSIIDLFSKSFQKSTVSNISLYSEFVNVILGRIFLNNLIISDEIKFNWRKFKFNNKKYTNNQYHIAKGNTNIF